MSGKDQIGSGKTTLSLVSLPPVKGVRWRDSICGFNVGDVAVAYLKHRGFVGVAQIRSPAKMIREVRIGNKPLLALPLKCPNMGDNSDDPELSEYICLVEWLKAVPAQEAKWRRTPKLYTTTHVRASLDGQRDTIAVVESAFNLRIGEAVA
jgi:hypothetical protein